jgi:hypothetical protein
MRADKGVSGKCVACEALKRALNWARSKKLPALSQTYHDLRRLHNDAFQRLERAQYYTMRSLARESPSEVRDDSLESEMSPSIRFRRYQ